MLNLDTFYTHLEYEYNEDLDYIDDIYNYLLIKRLLQENNDDKLVLEKMELLDEGLFSKLKYDDIQINSYTKLLEKYNKEAHKLEENINKYLKQFNKNIQELVLIQKDLSNAKLNYNECRLNMLHHKLEDWWSWISQNIIDNIISFKQGDTSDDISKILVCKKIFKLLNIYNKINSIENYTYKLIIFDIKNYGKKYLGDYEHILLQNFYYFLNEEFNMIYGTMFSIEIDIDSTEEIINYLLINENMYYLDKNDNVVIVEITSNIDLFYKLNMTYNLYKMLKLLLKEQYDTTQTILLDEKIQEYLKSLNSIINELSTPKIQEALNKSLLSDDSTKNKYYFFINYLNTVIHLVFTTHLDKLDKYSQDILINKLRILENNKGTYLEKV